MAELEIRGERVLVDDKDMEIVGRYTWGLSRHHSGIRYVRAVYNDERGKTVSLYMHRLVLGIQDAGRSVFADHINGNTLDNRRSNLRVVTPSQSNANRNMNPKKPKYGTIKFRDRYMSRIGVGGKYIYLGLFDTRDAGERAYIEASLRIHGDMSPLHRPSWRDERIDEISGMLNCQKSKSDREAELLRELAELRATA